MSTARRWQPATVAGQEASLANLDATRRLQLALIAQARPAIAAAGAEIVRTHDDQVRYRQLRASEAISVQDFQKAEADYTKGLASGESARATLLSAQRQLDVIETQKRQAEAALAAAIAERQTAELNLGYTELCAPVDGTVGNRSARLGSFAVVGAQLISLVPDQGLWVDANFGEPLANVRPVAGSVRADGPGRVFHGRSSGLPPGAQFSAPTENATGNLPRSSSASPSASS